jgi:glucose-1-phosphate adenylyltransferase
MQNMISVIMGGGKGTRLSPLTKYRSKPAVPLAGKYRIIDVPISNSINSGVNRIYILTQYNSTSLHRHVRQTYRFDPFDGGFVEIMAAQQTFTDQQWYQGTADAVRQNLQYFRQPGIEHVLILSGDQLYRMDYRDMLRTHQESGADVTIAGVPVTSDKASAFGVIQFDDSGRVVGFAEKPKTEEALRPVRTDEAWFRQHGIEAKGRDCLANMGVYLFNRDTLVEFLDNELEDFGKQVFPQHIESHRVHVHLFDGYWEDIGTIKAFFDANLELAQPEPPFHLVLENSPIYSRARYLPPTRLDGAKVSRSLLADGCLIGRGTVIENSVIGLRCDVGENVTIRNSVLMGNDYYTALESSNRPKSSEMPPVRIADGCHIEGAIIDKNCCLGRNVRVQIPESMAGVTDRECGPIVIRDGVIVVPRGATLPDNWQLA